MKSVAFGSLHLKFQSKTLFYFNSAGFILSPLSERLNKTVQAMRNCQLCPTLLSLPMGGVPVRALSTLLRAQDLMSASRGHQLLWALLGQSHLWCHSPALS